MVEESLGNQADTVANDPVQANGEFNEPAQRPRSPEQENVKQSTDAKVLRHDNDSLETSAKDALHEAAEAVGVADVNARPEPDYDVLAPTEPVASKEEDTLSRTNDSSDADSLSQPHASEHTPAQTVIAAEDSPRRQESTAAGDSAASRSTTPVPAPTETKTTGWGYAAYLKRAVANVEQTLDKVLQESTELNGPGRPSSSLSNAPPKQQSAVAPAAGTADASSKTRLSMQERLAMAVQARPGTPASRGSTPAQDSRPASPSSTVVTSELSVPPTNNRVASPIATEDGLTDDNNTVVSLIMALVSNWAEDKDPWTQLSPILHEARETFGAMENEIDDLKSKLEDQNRQIKEISEAELSRTHNLLQELPKDSFERLLAEKDQNIALLREEGQKLSKQELKYMTTIKKLRAQLKDSERSFEQCSKTNDRLEKELAAVKSKVKEVDDIERSKTDAQRAQQRLNSDLETLRREKTELQAKLWTVQDELKSVKLKADEGVMDAQKEQIKRLREELEVSKAEAQSLTERYADLDQSSKTTIAELEASANKAWSAVNKTKHEMEEEIKVLEARIEFYRGKAEDAAGATASNSHEASLLKQIEVLHSQHTVAQENWHEIETSLQAKAAKLETEVSQLNSRESYLQKRLKNMTESYKTQSQDVEQLQERLDKYQLAITETKAELRNCKAECESLKSELNDERARHEEQLNRANESISNLQTELHNAQEAASANLALSPHELPSLDFEDDAVPPVAIGEPLRPFDIQASAYSPAPQRISNSRNTSAADISFSSLARSRQHSLFSPKDSEISIDRSDEESAQTYNSTQPSMQLIGKLNINNRRLESEIASLKEDILRISAGRDDADKQVLTLMKEKEQLEKEVTLSRDLEKRVAELEDREQTALEMLGEKSEQVQELRADVADMKEMYRQQISDLIDQLVKAKQ